MYNNSTHDLVHNNSTQTIVHMVGGFTGLVGAIIVGPRTGRFTDGRVNELYSGNKTLQALGTFILWFGWYGFNAGSTLGMRDNLSNVAGKVVVNTTLAGACRRLTADMLY